MRKLITLKKKTKILLNLLFIAAAFMLFFLRLESPGRKPFLQSRLHLFTNRSHLRLSKFVPVINLKDV